MMFFIGILGLCIQDAVAIPQQMTQQGRLLDNTGNPITGIHTITFRIYDSAAGGQMLWDESQQTLFNNGFYSVFLGANSASNPLDDSLFDMGSIYLEVEVNNDGAFSPRTEIVSVPYARQAKTAFEVEGGVVNASEIRVGGSVIVDSNGAWLGQNIQSNWSDLINVPSDFSDGIDNDTQLTSQDVKNMIEGSSINLAANSQMDGVNLVTSESDSDNLRDLMVSCVDGQIPKYDATLGWGCSDDDVLSESDVETFVTNDAIDLASGSMVGSDLIVTTNTDLFLDEADVESYVTNDVIDLASGSKVGGDTIVTSSSDQVLSESDVESYVTNDAIDLAGGSKVGGDTIVTSSTDQVLSESDVETFVTNGSLDLAEGTTVNGKTILTATCPVGQILASDGTGWECMEFQALLDADNDNIMAWNDCNDADASIGDKANDADCDTVLTADDCDDTNPNSTTIATDADCDGVLTADDCNDDDANATVHDGSSAGCALANCQAILSGGYSTGSGVYYIDPLETSPYQAYCDMDTDGGGWTMVTSNNNSDTEPSGCFPQVSGYGPDFCGTVSSSQDFTVNASGISFTEMVFAAYTGDFDIQSYQYFTWNAAQEIPTASTWSLQADNYNQTLSDYSSLNKIYCTYSSLNRLEYVRLQNTLGGIVSRNTVFSVTDNAYEMSFMAEDNNSSGQTKGLDDWQDGDGCGDGWTPTAHRGFSAFVMIR